MANRERFLFVSNLKPETLDPAYPLTFKGEAFLVSEPYLTPKAVWRAKLAREKGRFLIADNGNFSRMCAIAGKFSAKGGKLLAEARNELEREGKISSETQFRRRGLMADIERACSEALKAQDGQTIIDRQLSIEPDLLVGLEDFTIPTLQLCGLLDRTFAPKPSEISRHQKSTITVFRTSAKKALVESSEPMLVVHAYDYDSAFQAGKALQKEDVGSFAISYGAPMKSNRWVETIDFGGRPETLPAKLPEKYLLAQSITVGFLNGIGRRVRLHILGAGSPILLVLTGLLAPYTTGLSLDSTSPFKDADDGILYGDRFGYLKLDMYRVLANSLIQSEPFESTNPFWKAFEKKYPSKLSSLRRELGVTARSEERSLATKLERETRLVEKYAPFFAKARRGTDALMKDLRVARAGYKYWVLRKICVGVRQRLDEPKALQAWVEGEVDQYARVADPEWAQVTRLTAAFTSGALAQNGKRSRSGGSD